MDKNKYKCEICSQRTYETNGIRCEDCGVFYHKLCLDPLRFTPWNRDEKFICDVCCSDSDYSEDLGDSYESGDESWIVDNDDSEEETFTESTCDCETCKDMNAAVFQWDDMEITSGLGGSFMRAVNAQNGLLAHLMRKY